MNVSLIIPAYNAKLYLEKTVESVISQPVKDIEIVIVDDGSTDGTDMLCDSLAEKYKNITCIHKKNGGVSSARNTGIEYFLNKNSDKFFIAFLDADDVWNKNIITDKLIENSKHTDMIVFNGVKSNNNMNRFTKMTNFKDHCYDRKVEKHDFVCNPSSHFCAKLYSSEILRKYNVRFNTELKYFEDLIFCRQFNFFSEIVETHKETLHIYRDTDNSVMTKANYIKPYDYFRPITLGWLRSDDIVNEYSDVVGRTSDSGKKQAIFYLSAMVEAACMRSVFYGMKIIKIVRESDEFRPLIQESNEWYQNPGGYALRTYLKNLPGSIRHFMYYQMRLFKIPIVVKYKDKVRYPYTELPELEI